MRSIIRMRGIAFATLLLSLLVFAPQSAQAATLTVSNTADSGAGSLRQAIIDATSNAAANSININIPLTDPGYNSATDRFTITLVNQLPDLPLAPLTIDNMMGRALTVKGNGSFRIFTLVNSAVVNISNLTMSQGSSGGGKGGGIYMGDSAVLFLNNCTVNNNTASNGGGGIWVNDSGTLHVIGSTISNNTATNAEGGGIYINNSGTLNIMNSTVSGNFSQGSGGGIYNGVSGTVNATNITVNGNASNNLGGGIANTATLNLNSSTVSGNTAANGGGIFNNFTATLNNSLIALNTGADGSDLLGRGSRGKPFSGNNNLVGNADGSEAFGPTTNQLGTTGSPINPRLGPLQDNGGSTFTQALFSGSPAIDAGATALATDQRGVTRPQNGDGVGGAQSDIGSFENEGLPELTINDVTVAEPSSGSRAAIFTVSLSRSSSAAISVNFATADGTASVAGSDYVTAGGTLVFAAGEITKTVTVNVLSDAITENDETFKVNLTSAQGGAQIPDNQGIGTILPPTPLPTTGFGAASYTIAEGLEQNTDPASLIITVTRTGDLSIASTVEYRTLDLPDAVRCDAASGVAYHRCDYATTIGTLRFNAGETEKSFHIFITDDVHREGNETFQIGLTNASGANVGSQATATVTILDNDVFTSRSNPIDAPEFFVRHQYIDFLMRAPETTGYNDWLRVLNTCGAGNGDKGRDPACDRLVVSSSFFRSDEFLQVRGYFAHRFYEVAFDRSPSYLEFIRDLQSLSAATPEEATARRASYIVEFTERQAFRDAFPSTMTMSDYVNALFIKAELGERGSITRRNGTTVTRAQLAEATRTEALREIVESSEVEGIFYNRAFVAAQYFGYLRRDPEPQGYSNWLNYLNANPSNYRTMVNGFMNSHEYRLRFGQP